MVFNLYNECWDSYFFYKFSLNLIFLSLLFISKLGYIFYLLLFIILFNMDDFIDLLFKFYCDSALLCPNKLFICYLISFFL
jgi:hypothetical protein